MKNIHHAVHDRNFYEFPWHHILGNQEDVDLYNKIFGTSITILQSSGQDQPGWNGRSGVVGGSFGAEKKLLIKAAPLGRLDQMLRTTEWRRKKNLIEAPRSNAKDSHSGGPVPP